MAKQTQADYNAPLLNAISPMGIKLTDNHQIQLGEVQGPVQGVIRYPAVVDYEWLTEVCNLNNTITALTTDGIRAIYTGETTKWSDAK